MPRIPKRDYSGGPVWDEELKRWLAELIYPDQTRRRRRFRRQRDAQIWWATQQKSIEDGSWEAAAKPNPISLGDALAQYREYSKAHHRSYATYVETGLSVLEEALGSGTLLGDIATADIERLKLQRLEKDKVSKSTVDKNVAVAKSFFSWSIHQGLTNENPVKKVKLFHEDNERVRFLDPETEYPKLLREARKGPWYLDPIIVVDVNTGLRRRNILNLRWDQIDFKRRVVRIESRTKSGRPHNVPLNDTVLRKLKEVHRKTGFGRYVFVHLEGKHAGRPVTDIKNAFNGAIDRAKIKDFRFHDLRHTFCSWLAIRGVPLNAIQKLAGHASIKMTLRYAHLSPRYLANEVKALDRLQRDSKPRRDAAAESVASAKGQARRKTNPSVSGKPRTRQRRPRPDIERVDHSRANSEQRRAKHGSRFRE